MAVTKPGNSDLAEEIKGYAAYFGKITKGPFEPATASGDVLARPTPNFQEPMAAVKSAFDDPWQNSPKWGALDRDAFRPEIQKWMKEHNVTGLARMSHGYNGWTAECFDARIENSSVPQIIRIGSETGEMKHLSRNWNPLLVHPHEQTIFVQPQENDLYKFSIERLPLTSMARPGEPPGFDKFLNEHILTGTPYEIKSHKDLSVFTNGFAIYGDPDSIGFKTPELAQKHAQDQWDPAWQQKNLKTIYENSERAGLPKQMRWVQQTSPGVYEATKIPDPTPAKQVRTVISLPSAEDGLMRQPQQQQQAQHLGSAPQRPGKRSSSAPTPTAEHG